MTLIVLGIVLAATISIILAFIFCGNVADTHYDWPHDERDE